MTDNTPTVGDLTWVERVQTIDALDHQVIEAVEANPGWRLIATGTGTGGQTTLTYGWPWPGSQSCDQNDHSNQGEA